MRRVAAKSSLPVARSANPAIIAPRYMDSGAPGALNDAPLNAEPDQIKERCKHQASADDAEPEPEGAARGLEPIGRVESAA